MSKRYGRNQKRRHRERIAELERDRADLIDAGEGLKAAASGLKTRIERWAYTIRSVLGPHHPFNEEVRKRLVEHLNMTPPRLMWCESAKLSLDEVIRVETVADYNAAAMTLELLVHRVAVRGDDFDVPRVIFTLASEDGRSQYAIDSRELESGMRDPRFLEWLAGQLALELAMARRERNPVFQRHAGQRRMAGG